MLKFTLRHSNIRPFVQSFLATALAALISDLYFHDYEIMATCALVAFGLGPTMHELLEFNRKSIWGNELSAWAANKKLAIELVSLFFGTFLAAAAYYTIFQEGAPNAPASLYQNTFGSLFLHNLRVLTVGCLFSFLYRASGLVLVLSWNAVIWAKALCSYIAAIGSASGSFLAAILSVGLMPHLVLEVAAYITAGMGGLFLSKGFAKYELRSSEFLQVAKASLTLFATSIGILLLAALAEIIIGQPLYHLILAN